VTILPVVLSIAGATKKMVKCVEVEFAVSHGFDLGSDAL
jgi:hypothetical protein